MGAELNETDRKLIYHLADNAREQVTVLGKKMRMSRDTLNYRINRLVENGIIKRFVPIIDIDFFGYNTYHVYYVTNDSPKEKRQEFLEALKNHPNTKRVTEYTDRWEIGWDVIAKDIFEFDEITSELSTQYSPVIIEKVKLKLVRGYKSLILPERYNPAIDPEFNYKRKEYAPDEKDILILKELSKNCRTSSYEIAEKTKISPNNVRYRLKHMEDSQLIRKYSIETDLEALDYHAYTVCVTLKYLDKKQEAKLREFVKSQRFIIRAVKVIGHWDIVLTIVSDSLRNFHKTVMEFQDMFADIIINYETLISYKQHCYYCFPKVLDKEQKN